MAGSAEAIMHTRSVPEGIAWQADHAENAGAPGTARVIRGLLPVLETDTAVGRRMANWQGLVVEDAMPLRIVGGLHYLLLSGTDRRLEPVYAGITTDQGKVDDLVVGLVETFDHVLLPWLDHPPQTNEAGRSASLMAGLMWLSGRIGPRFEMNEIGASAGINTMMERFRFDLGGVSAGPATSPIRLAPEWRGAPPPGDPVTIEGIRGCDVKPLDLRDPDTVLRLKSYVWPEARERMGRIDRAALLTEDRAPELDRMAADEWVEEVLAEPQVEGVARTLFHSIVWQYLPETARDRIVAAMERAGRAATAQKPLAWLMLETNRETFAHELRARHWPGPDEWTLLATAHPHGAWVKWLG
ncbi:DUF2332 domain-containing protein [Pelagerythrobacter sp.]|uniref:DUF2332 domain-containing protein n=1 Tax=Pelagerythrobacter sp. TaxID=2800702 RepID=UPI0035B0BA02